MGDQLGAIAERRTRRNIDRLCVLTPPPLTRIGGSAGTPGGRECAANRPARQSIRQTS
jgi:hypothetical protein